MKLYILLSGRFGEKVIGSLVNLPTFCRACGSACNFCRAKRRSFSAEIAGVHVEPDDLPDFLDEPEDHLPKNPPRADIIIPIGIHPDILSVMPRLAKKISAKGVIVPMEDVDWCPQKLRQNLKTELDAIGIESAFPKPFCALEENGGPIVDQFVREFQIGRPRLEAKIHDGVIREVEVIRSSPCGSTWFTAHEIKDMKIGDLDQIIWRSHRGYPCTASTHIDPETGEPFLNLSGQRILDAVHNAISKDVAPEAPTLIRKD